MKYKVNLLSVKKQRPADRIIYFSLNYLRYILVITGIVVNTVFLYKLKVDQEKIDLQEAVDQKKEIVLVAEPLVKEAKKVDFQLAQMKKVLDAQDDFNSGLSYILSTFPEDFYLTQYNFEKSKIILKGTTVNADLVRLYLNRLKKDAKFKSVKLSNVLRSDAGYIFTYELDASDSADTK